MDGTIEIFKKRPGCGDAGKDYENVNVANVILKMVLDEKITDFQVSSNDDEFAAFDDIVIKANNGCVKCAVQLKHSENKRRLIPKQLEDLNGDFSLVKYAKSFRQICKSQESYKYILHTNRECNLADGQVIDLKEIGLTVKVVTAIPDALLNTSEKNVCFKFLLNQIYIHTPVTLEEIEIYENFFENFYLHTNQADVSKTDRDVFRKFRTFFNCSIVEYEKYKKFIVEWSKQESKKKEKLNETVMRRVIVLSVLSPYINVSFNFGEVNKKMKILRSAIDNFGITVVDEKGYQIIKKLFGDVKNSDLSEINKIRLRYKLNIDYIKCIDEVQEDKEFSKLFWIMCKVPLIVKTNETIHKAIKICQNEKFIIIDNDFIGDNVLQNLSSLEKNSELYNKIMQEFLCSLQGKNQISLGTLVKECTEFKKIITTNILLEMSQVDVYNFEDNLETLPVPYIKRYLSTTIVDFSIFENVDKKTLIVLNCKNRFNSIESRLTKFVVEDIDEIEKITINNTNKKFIIIAQNECKYEDVKRILPFTKFQKFCHFELTKTGHLELLHGLDKLNLPFKENISISEEFLSKSVKYKLNLIIGEPGMGKTTLLRSLKNNLSSNYLSYILYPQDISYICRQIKECQSGDYYEIFYNFLLSNKSFNDKFFHLMMNKNQVVIMFDALDEIWYENLETITNLIILLFEKNITQYVTCRTRLQIYLERKLGIFSKRMRPFDSNDQNLYIQSRLSEKYPDQDHSQTIEIIKNLINYKDVLGIPLQIYMLTELFRENKEKYSKFTSQSFNITDLYRYFVEEKFKFCYNKFATSIDLQKIVFDQEMRTKIFRYQEAALKLLIPRILTNKIECYDFLQDVKNDGDPMGILVSVSQDNIPSFFHLAFAEYFVALYFSRRYGEIPDFENILFEDGHKNIKLYFDLLLAPNHPAHVAILYKNIELLENLNDDIKKQNDLGGRNLLHLAASWGQSYPEFQVYHDKQTNCYTIEPRRLNSLKNESFKYCRMLLYLSKICNLEQQDGIFNWTPMSYAKRFNALLEKSIFMRHQRKKYLTLNDDLKMASFLYFSADFGYDHVFEIYEYFPRVTIQHFPTTRTLLDVAASSKDGVLYAFKLLATDVHKLNKNLPKWLCIIGEQFEKIEKGKRQQLLGYNFDELFRKLIEIFKTSTVDVNVLDDEKRSPIHWACLEGQTKLVELLVELNAAINISDKSGLTPLMIACEHRHEDVVKLLLEFEANVNFEDNLGRTALHYASYGGSTTVIKLLLDLNVDKNRKDINGKTALHWGCYSGHSNGVKLLLQSGMSLNDRDKYGKTPLHWGCYTKSADVVRLLLEHVDNINVSDNRGKTPLHIACKRKQVELVKLLLEFSNFNVNIRDRTGKTPLHFACQKKQYYLVKLLLKCDVDVNVRSNAGKTPLYIACEKKEVDIVKLLLKRGANPNISHNNRQTPLHVACKTNDYNIAKVLLQFHANVNSRDGRGQTGLYIACGWIGLGKPLIPLLLKYKADTNLADVNGQTPLHKMSGTSESNLVKLLLESGADVNVRNRYGRTPLHAACRYGQKDTVKLLLDWKADPNIVDQNNRTPIDWGCKWGKWWLCKLFEKRLN